MATSNSTDFTLNRNEIINAAFRTIGVGVRGEALSAEEIADGSEALNLILKELDAEGLPLWRRDKLSLTLVASQAVYTIGPSGADVTAPRPLRVLEANRLGSSDNSAPIEVLSLNEWSLLPNRATASAGAPVNAYFDPTTSSATLNIWPMPDATSAAAYTVEFWVHSPIEDMDSSTDNVDCPPEWLRAIKYMLAYDLADEYSIPDNMYYRIRKKAEQATEKVLSWDVEDTSFYFQPYNEGC